MRTLTLFLCSVALRHDRRPCRCPPGAEPARFRRSVAQLHANMLAGYGDWCAAVDLPERVPEVEHGALSRGTGTPVRRSTSWSVS